MPCSGCLVQDEVDDGGGVGYVDHAVAVEVGFSFVEWRTTSTEHIVDEGWHVAHGSRAISGTKVIARVKPPTVAITVKEMVNGRRGWGVGGKENALYRLVSVTNWIQKRHKAELCAF